MKFRLTLSIIILSLFLVSFSSAKDITSSPGTNSPSSVPTQATETPAAESTPTSTTQPTTPPATAPAIFLGNFTGSLINGSGGGIPEGQTVSLIGLDKDKTGSYQKVLELQAPVNRDGSYNFTGVEILINRAILIVASYGGIEYQSDPVLVNDTRTKYSISITIYDKSNDFNVLRIDQVHLKFDYTSANVIQVTELFVVTNPGKLVVVVTGDGTTIPFFKIPAGASSLQYQLAQGSTQLLNATGGFALLPGADKQYGFLASFSMPYGRNLKYDQLFALPVTSLTVFVPQGMRLSGKQLTTGATQTIQSQIYLTYETNKMSAGSSLSVALSGKPGDSTGFKFDRQTIVWIIISMVGILLVGLGVYFYLHDKSRLLLEELEEQKEYEVHDGQDGQITEEAPGDDRDKIMDAMFALDDHFKAGEIPQDAYEKNREELKERLKGIINSSPDTPVG